MAGMTLGCIQCHFSAKIGVPRRERSIFESRVDHKVGGCCGGLCWAGGWNLGRQRCGARSVREKTSCIRETGASPSRFHDGAGTALRAAARQLAAPADSAPSAGGSAAGAFVRVQDAIHAVGGRGRRRGRRQRCRGRRRGCL